MKLGILHLCLFPGGVPFKATFTDMALTECKWLAHDGQQPDEA